MKLNIITALVVVIASALAGCTTDSTLDPKQPIKPLQGPVVAEVHSPYERAMACIAKIPEVRSVRVGVDSIQDLTGKANIQVNGTGSFITQGATDMMTTSLAKLGVQVVELSVAYKANVDWYAAKGVKGSIKQPQFIVLGSVTALDFGTAGTAAELAIHGVGPKARAYRATGRMDLRIVTLPYGKTTGGSVQAVSAFQKEFAAIETGFGAASFIGGGTGLTYVSFNLSSNKREPMQATIGFMSDYGASDLILGLLNELGYRPREVANCRRLLVDPQGTTGEVRVATAD